MLAMSCSGSELACNVHAWAHGSSPLRHERLFDPVPEVSMNLGCFRVKGKEFRTKVSLAIIARDRGGGQRL
jgi:hypothetical protein